MLPLSALWALLVLCPPAASPLSLKEAADDLATSAATAVKAIEGKFNFLGEKFNENIDIIHDTDHGVRICNDQDTRRTGVCFSAGKCRLLGGEPVGEGCQIFTPKTTCCHFRRSCGSSSEQTVTYFDSSLVAPSCALHLESRIGTCQVRLDLLDFLLPVQGEAGECDPDRAFKGRRRDHGMAEGHVTSEGRTLLVLCGRNSGQHLYLEVERQGQEFELRAGLKDKFVLGEEARFNIKVTQVDCRSGVPSMRALVAPSGCLQYFAAEVGSFSSFNFHSQLAIALGQEYSICFRSSPETCQLNLSPLHFEMPGTEGQCTSSYVQLPGMFNSENPSSSAPFPSDRLCGAPTLSPGSSRQKPFVVRVRTDEQADGDSDGPAATGFSFSYEILAGDKCLR